MTKSTGERTSELKFNQSHSSAPGLLGLWGSNGLDWKCVRIRGPLLTEWRIWAYLVVSNPNQLLTSIEKFRQSRNAGTHLRTSNLASESLHRCRKLAVHYLALWAQDHPPKSSPLIFKSIQTLKLLITHFRTKKDGKNSNWAFFVCATVCYGDFPRPTTPYSVARSITYLRKSFFATSYALIRIHRYSPPIFINFDAINARTHSKCFTDSNVDCLCVSSWRSLGTKQNRYLLHLLCSSPEKFSREFRIRYSLYRSRSFWLL